MQSHTHTHTHTQRKSEGSTQMAKIGKYSRTEARYVPMAWVSHMRSFSQLYRTQNHQDL